VTLNNYRCFRSLEIDLHPRLTVLIGGNGAGKTAVLDGIAAGLSPILNGLSSANQRLSAESAEIKDTDFRLEPWEAIRGKARWGASDYSQTIVETTSGLKWDYWRASIAGKKPPITLGESDLASYLTKILDSFKTSYPEILPVFAYYGTQRGRIEIPELLRLPDEKYSYHISALINALDSSGNFKELLTWFYIEENHELRQEKHSTGDGFFQSRALQAVRSVINIILNGEYLDPYFNEDDSFLVKSSKTGIELQVSQLSQGYQSMLALSMDFARRLAIADNMGSIYEKSQDAISCVFGDLPPGHKKSLLNELESLGWSVTEDGIPEPDSLLTPAIMLVDEIDLHLHPSWQQRVLNDLMRAFPSTQFIVTTHSPQGKHPYHSQNRR
jgi:predicted ATP-binding protein involved in virulence